MVQQLKAEALGNTNRLFKTAITSTHRFVQTATQRGKVILIQTKIQGPNLKHNADIQVTSHKNTDINKTSVLGNPCLQE